MKITYYSVIANSEPEKCSFVVLLNTDVLGEAMTLYSETLSSYRESMQKGELLLCEMVISDTGDPKRTTLLYSTSDSWEVEIMKYGGFF